MKLIKLVLSFPKLQDFAKYKFKTYAKSREIYELYKQIEKEYEYYIFEEQKMVETYAKKDENGLPQIDSGKISFDTMENAQKYKNEINNLSELEIEIKPVRVTETDLCEIPTPELMASLDGIILFE